jgi:hypothetical protein
MSIQTYNKPVYYDDRMVEYNPSTGETNVPAALTSKNGITADFQVNLKVLKGRDSYSVRSSTYTIVGTSETGISGRADIANALMGLMEAGARWAQNVAALSKGVLVAFYMKCGKYRQDEMPINVPTGDNSWGKLILSNNPNAEYGRNECDAMEEFPMERASAQIFIPWLRDDVSQADIINTVDSFEYVDSDSGFTFTLGQSRFKDDNKVDIVALPTAYCKDVKRSARSRTLGGLLANNDSALGILTDKVLSEEFNTVEGGADDGLETNP